ncbi:DUF3019 domain-containing protein [Aliiglaciecola sp. CAU 1673]|uniref:DUF3019 domain-containing protein n=1 Tax=Aliiglaciecola sp. CAU 1673 TaxID=3032595 RepID=UPI0023DB6B31|nr:DUF3019 domain-containing protein [Aliiglaciecola sp. CAU 1673]MDF2177905.1 DUF3019 domain-containing protein [Aliiglaciecola sp. CAU 1673]
MKRKDLFALLILWISAGGSPIAVAQERAWALKPTVCVVERLGEVCELPLNIELFGVFPAQACLFLQSTELACWSPIPSQISVVVEYNEPAEISLRDPLDLPILSSHLDIKALIPVRRRVRAPWSLF